MIHLDLFSGIGGFSLAADRVWGKENITHIFCDNDKYCQTILKKHWPEAQIFGDIRTLTTDSYGDRFAGGDKEVNPTVANEQAQRLAARRSTSPFILTGGFPCQPFSQAGRRKGTDDDDGNGDALHSGERCDIIEICNGDTTTSVQNAGNSRGDGKAEVIAHHVRPSTKRNGEQKISIENERATKRGVKNGNTRFTDDMEGNASVAEKKTLHSSQSTTRMEGETRSGGNITAKLGNSLSKTDTPRHTNFSATTATTPSTTSESVRTKDEGIFLLTGGFPCQPFSQAGRRKGTQDDRFLWPEMFRVIREFRPQWVIGENVAGLLTISEGMVLKQVCADLESENYEVQCFVIPAVAVNAPHRRDRVWIVAHRNDPRDRTSPSGTDENGEKIGEQRKLPQHGTGGQGSDAPHTTRKGLERSRGKRRGLTSNAQILERQSPETQNAGPSWETNWIEVASALCDVAYELPAGLVRPNGERDTNYPWWRTQALKAGGNSIVPKVAEEIMRGIKLTNKEE